MTIRTLDLGADKQLPYLGHQGEANPFMGFRSIRLSSRLPGVFPDAAAGHPAGRPAGNGGTAVSDGQHAGRGARPQADGGRDAELNCATGVPFGENVPLGVMIEVPAAALCIDEILREVDFVSIGSNDLIQYLMAADRDNPKVAHLCEPFSPALLRLLNHVIRACNEHGKPVTLCGEMAGRRAASCRCSAWGCGG